MVHIRAAASRSAMSPAGSLLGATSPHGGGGGGMDKAEGGETPTAAVCCFGAGGLGDASLCLSACVLVRTTAPSAATALPSIATSWWRCVGVGVGSNGVGVVGVGWAVA